MRRLLTPGWIVAHVVVLAIAIVFVNLGFWQLRRLDERRAFNQTLTARSGEPVVPLGSVLAPDGDPDPVAYRRLTVEGVYDTSNELILLSRARRGVAGHHVVTPLVTDDGAAVLVDRGWVPFRLDEPPVAEAAPPEGRVRVEGIVFPTQTRGRFGPQQDPGEQLTQIFRIDIDRLAPQFPYPVYPVWLLLEEQTPSQTGVLPEDVEPPRLDEGPHLAYAIQWFLFTAILLTGYPVLARQRLRARERAARATQQPPVPADAP